jgi:hypothetical protein
LYSSLGHAEHIKLQLQIKMNKFISSIVF